MKRIRLCIIFCLIAGFSCLSSFLFLNYPVFRDKNNTPLIIHFEPGMNAAQLVNLLQAKRSLNCSLCLALYLRLQPNSNQLQAGVYQLESSIKLRPLVRKLLLGDVLEQQFTIKEGQVSQDILKQLEAQPFVKEQKELEHQLYASCDFCINNIEGMFLANTYLYLAGSSSFDVLMRSHLLLKDELDNIWRARQSNLPYTNSYELLIAASIIEKETAFADEKRWVSAVIVNRLRANMRLQMDPTVIYGLNERYRYPLTRKDLRIKTIYNSYLNKGLPPTPIANVGGDSLKAAANPAKVPYLYFVATSKGRHKFSNTLAEQVKAIKTNKAARKEKKRH